VAARGADLAKEIVDADAMVGVPLTPELFKQAKQLKWLHISSTGVERHGGQVGLFAALIESDVTVTNAKNVYGPQIADHAFAFLLALTRRLNVTIPRQHEWHDSRHHRCRWDRQPDRPAGAWIRHEGHWRRYP